MTKKSIKVSVGLAGALALFAFSSCGGGNSSGNTGGTGGTVGSGGASGGTTGNAGQSGGGTTGSGGTGGIPGTGGTTVPTGGTTGSGGSGGSTGTGGTTASGGAGGSGGSTVVDESVYERGKRPSRDGNYIQASLTTTAAMTKVAPDTTFNTNATFTGRMYASPLYLEKGPNGMGIFIAATGNNDVKAFYDSGMPAWTRAFGAVTKGPNSGTGQGGIMSTPVIDSTPAADGSSTIYVVAQGAATAGGQFDHYELHAISSKDGMERTGGWPVKIDGTLKATNDGLNRAFVPGNEGQRAALSLVNGIVYIGFGGPYGDFSTYFAWVVAVDTKNPTTIGAWSSRSGGAAIWSPGGFASDGNGILITTGNLFGAAFPGGWGDQEAIIRLTGTPTALTRSDYYYPTRYMTMDSGDQDFGSSSVLLLNVPGATPANYGITESKDGHLYMVNAAKLGATTGGGEVTDLILSSSVHSARTSPVSYTTSTGIHVALTVDRGQYPGCPATPAVDPALAVLEGLTVTAGSPATIALKWCTNIGGPAAGDNGTIKNRSASPLVTTTDGHSQPIVWVAGSASQATAGTSANLLYGIDGETGAILYKDTTSVCGGIRQWTTPIAVKGHIVVGGDGKLCSWSAH
ncbi:MAG TPA: hypothetical protein VHJ20_21110 [Polyangia bacterium]|nr:hypothetical protein [Polyangia bacterium]